MSINSVLKSSSSSSSFWSPLVENQIDSRVPPREERKVGNVEPKSVESSESRQLGKSRGSREERKVSGNESKLEESSESV